MHANTGYKNSEHAANVINILIRIMDSAIEIISPNIAPIIPPMNPADSPSIKETVPNFQLQIPPTKAPADILNTVEMNKFP